MTRKELEELLGLTNKLMNENEDPDIDYCLIKISDYCFYELEIKKVK